MKSIESCCLLLLGKQVFHKPQPPVIYVIIKEKNDMTQIDNILGEEVMPNVESNDIETNESDVEPSED